jgi:DNA-binding transcriptional regulator YbjK
MSEGQLRPGSFVRYGGRNGRVGKVKEIGDGNPAVLFWADRESGDSEKIPPALLTPLADDGPEALLWERPEELGSWAKERPLQLVALALSFEGGTGKAAEIKEKVDKRVPLGSAYTTWWNRTKPKLNLPEPQEHFKTDKAIFILLSSVSEVPPDANLPTYLLAEWKFWFLSEASAPPIWSRWPNAEAFAALDNALEQLSGRYIEEALLRAMRGAEEFLTSDKTPKPAATNWLETVGRTFLRRRECSGSDSDGYMNDQVTQILTQLCEIAGYNKAGKWLLLAHEDDSWQQGVAAGMWAASNSSNDRARRSRLFQAASELLGRQGRADLAREIALAAFRTDYQPIRYSEIDQHLQDLATDAAPVHRLYELIALAQVAGAKDKVLDYLANSRHTRGVEHLSLRIAAALMLSEGRGEFATETSRQLADSLNNLETLGPEVQAVLADTAIRVKKIIADKDKEMLALKEAHDAELDQERQEREWLQERVETLRNQLFSGYEHSKLDIRQDMLVIVGELSQLAVRQDSPSEDLLRDVRAGLALALQAGDATALGSTGDVVAYDQLKHQSPESVRIGDSVKITAPGVVVKGQRTEDRILVKAQVSMFSERS